jgi:hypothetical protein
MRGVKRIKLVTYYKGKEIHKKDSTTFSVPMEWLKELLRVVFETTLDDFKEDYTWDDSEWIYYEAKRAGLLAY